MIGLIEPLVRGQKRVTNGVRFQGFFGAFASLDFEPFEVVRGARLLVPSRMTLYQRTAKTLDQRHRTALRRLPRHTRLTG